MKKGDIVIIKDFKDIEKELDYDDFHNGLYFERDGMSKFCGMTVELLGYQTPVGLLGRVWQVKTNSTTLRWYWHQDWLVKPFLSDKDFDI